MSISVKLAGESVPPLVVDLDGTLIRSDLLVESFFAYLGAEPFRFLSLATALRRGKAPFKAEIAQRVAIEPAHLPYDERVLSLIREARDKGGRVFLASASHERYVRDVAEHLGLFDGWFASTDNENLSSSTKAKRLVLRGRIKGRAARTRRPARLSRSQVPCQPVSTSDARLASYLSPFLNGEGTITGPSRMSRDRDPYRTG
jgi:haloacid dehalogenase-like hydrolase